jgi:LysM repeat protein
MTQQDPGYSEWERGATQPVPPPERPDSSTTRQIGQTQTQAQPQPRPWPTPGRQERHVLPTWALALAVLALLIVGVWYFFLSDRVAAPPEPQPSAVASQPAAAPPPSVAPSPTAPAAPQTYTVQEGDTLGQIAEELGTSAQALAAENGITDPNLIVVGQELRVPQPSPAPS